MKRKVDNNVRDGVDSSDHQKIHDDSDEDDGKIEDLSEALEEEEFALLSELLKLHQKLDKVRLNSVNAYSNDNSSNANAYTQQKRRPLFDGFQAIVCGNSAPVSVILNEQGTGYIYRTSVDTLKSAFDTLSAQGSTLQWLSWPGCTGVTEFAKNGIEKKLLDEFNCKPIFLEVNTAQGYMEFCDEVLYPIFFSMLVTENTSNLNSEHISSSTESIPLSSIYPSFAQPQISSSTLSKKMFRNSQSSVRPTFLTPPQSPKQIPQTPSLSIMPDNHRHQQSFDHNSSFTIGMSHHQQNHYANSMLNANAHAMSILHGNPVSVFLATLKLRMSMYEEVQKKYLGRLTEIYDNEDKHIIVNDIGLMLLPRLIRRRFQNASIIFVMRSPFPPFDVFSVFSHRQELLEGCLGADIIMFDHFHFIQNFIGVCERLLGLETSPSFVEFEGRAIKLIVSPPGIIPRKYAMDFNNAKDAMNNNNETILEQDAISIGSVATHVNTSNGNVGAQERNNIRSTIGDSDSDETKTHLAHIKQLNLKYDKIKTEFFGKKVVVAHDKLNRVSGILQKISAFAQYLKETPTAWQRKQIVLVQIVHGWTVPNITGKRRYATNTLKFLSKQINKLVSSVNGMYGAVDYVPIRLLRNVDFYDRLILYYIADVGIVSTLKGGIDTSGLEFVAAQDERSPGVLLYSEFLSCATSLKGAITINPYDVDAVAEALKGALAMTIENRQLRLLKLVKYVRKYNAKNWASQLVKESNKMSLVKLENKSLLLPTFHDLQTAFVSSAKRLFIFSYQGVLSPNFSAFPQVAPPSSKTLRILRHLCDNPNNVVYVMGGINKINMETWFSEIPRLGLIMEYGYAFKLHDEESISNGDYQYENNASTGRVKSKWYPTSGSWDINLVWKHDVMEILHHYATRTPGAYIDVSLESSIVWHYHHADIDVGQAQAKELYTLLDSMLSLKPVEVVFSSKARAIVIRPIGCNGATALSRVLDRIMNINQSHGNTFTGTSSLPLSQASSAIMKLQQATVNYFDFTFCVASHRYDIGLFNPILSRYRDGGLRNAFTCMTPKGVSKAQYYVDKRENILEILEKFCATAK
jgi:trehalose-6-phosphate synthase/trehalose-6-phosphatase